MRSRIYVCMHKAAETPPDALYVPLQLGAAVCGRASLGVLRDDRGVNISAKNPYYSELTGLYWIWKNDRDSDILGLCHYRRYLLSGHGKLFTEEGLKRALAEYDVITTRQVQLDYPYKEAFAGKHNPRDLELLIRSVGENEPDYMPECEAALKSTRTYFGNMLIAPRGLFCAYAEWLFSILQPMEEWVDMRTYDGYQQRLYGFLSELLLGVYLRHNGLKVLECDVAVMGEKKETRETIDAVAAYFAKGEVHSAAEYLMTVYRKRPDIMMEASDPAGKIRLLMQMLATYQAELEESGRCSLDPAQSMEERFADFRRLNTDVMVNLQSCEAQFSERAIEIARHISEKSHHIV